MWLHSAHNMGLNRNDITANENENCFYCVGAHSVRLFFFNLRESFFACVHLCVINQKKNLYGLMVFHWIFTVLLVQIDFIVVSMFCNIKWVMDGVRLLSMECELCGRMATATVVAMAVKKTRIQITTVSVIISMRKLGNCIMFHRLNESKQPTHTHTHSFASSLSTWFHSSPWCVASSWIKTKVIWPLCMCRSFGWLCVCACKNITCYMGRIVRNHRPKMANQIFQIIFKLMRERERVDESASNQAKCLTRTNIVLWWCSSVSKSNGWY